MIDPVFQTASKKLAIAHVHTGLVGSGGDRVSELEAHYLVSRGHQVTVVGLTAPDTAARLAAHGIAIVNEPAEIRSVEAILARTGGFDIVHCHCILSAPFAASLAKSSGAVFVIHSHSMGESWWESTSIISRLLSRRQGLRREIDHAFASADLILCVSEAVLGHLRAIGLPTEQGQESGHGAPHSGRGIAVPSWPKHDLDWPAWPVGANHAKSYQPASTAWPQACRKPGPCPGL